MQFYNSETIKSRDTIMMKRKKISERKEKRKKVIETFNTNF